MGEGPVGTVKDLLDGVRVVQAQVDHGREMHTADPHAHVGTELKDRVGDTPSGTAEFQVEVG
jgi:hypothetical protein